MKNRVIHIQAMNICNYDKHDEENQIPKIK